MATIGTLKYRLYQASNPMNTHADRKWYARAVQDRTVDFESFVTHIPLLSRRNSWRADGYVGLLAGTGT